MSTRYDAVVVGSGPNGLTAAVLLARQGLRVRVLEAEPDAGGGLRTRPLTLPGYQHDLCSAIHPTAVLSPVFGALGLEVEWAPFSTSIGHPIDERRSVVSHRSLDAAADALGRDGAAYRRLVAPFVTCDLFEDVLAPPLRVPRHPLLFARFGLTGLRSARSLAQRFATPEARALIAGCAAHSILPLEAAGTAAMALVFLASTHLVDWPCVRGGSGALAAALVNALLRAGGEIELGRRVTSLDELPPHRVALFDTSPRALSAIAGHALPARTHRAFQRYRYGPGVFKVDFALEAPIPWRHEGLAEASTVHVGGTFEEVADSERAMWAGPTDREHTERPFLIVCQQSHQDSTRAPPGRHTGYAYCHVPAGSTADHLPAVMAQLERHAPGFSSRVLATRVSGPAALEAENANLIGGAIAGGATTLAQVFARPTLRLDPYRTPNPRIFLCSASTPPGGGVHGMCGYWAARSALRALGVKGDLGAPRRAALR